MNEIILKAYAKVNTYLDVLGKRDDGYHDILSHFHTVSLCDEVTVKKAEDITMEYSCPSLTCGEDNLCIKAARAFFRHTEIDAGCYIYLKKVIPTQAGLGGGSADCAAVLKGLNFIYGSALSEEELEKLGASLGADVPFFIKGGSSIVSGIGERISPFVPIENCFLVISSGIGKVSTPEAYKIIDSTQRTKEGDFLSYKIAVEKGDIDGICRHLYNRFEDTLPSCEQVKHHFKRLGCDGTLMSGSGSAVFGIFKSENAAKNAEKELKDLGFEAFFCEFI